MSKTKKEQKPITIGSVVVLKSGGPNMTVVKAVSSVEVVLTVVWADSTDRLAKADLPIQALKLVR